MFAVDNFLKTLFIVSDVSIVHRDMPTHSSGWAYSSDVDISGTTQVLRRRTVQVRLTSCCFQVQRA